MLSELFTSLTTPCLSHVRNMDYLHEAIAMRGRYERNRASWQGHLERSREFMLSCAGKCPDRKKVLVLGAGLLLDIPLDALTSMFEQVVLVDIVFLPEVRKRVKKYDSVTIVAHDVTDIAETLYDSVRQGVQDLPRSVPRILELAENAGLVVSLNILSQLWVIPRAYVLRNMPGLDAERVDDWCRQIVDAHYETLLSLPCNVCVIADHEFEERDRRGRVVSNDSTVSGLSLPTPDASWMWDIAPRGEHSRFLARSLKVGGWYLNKTTHTPDDTKGRGSNR